MAFDTLRYTQRLEQVGVSREQADAHAELARDIVIADLVTKADLIGARSELQTDIRSFASDLQAEIKSLRSDLQAEIKLLEQRMTIRPGAMIVAGVGVLAAVQKLF